MTSAIAVALVIVPWALGGVHPTREDRTWAIILAFAAGFLSIGATVVSAFDIARLEAAGDARSSGPSSDVSTETEVDMPPEEQRAPRT